VLDQLLYVAIVERLSRLRLPGQHALLRDAFFKDMVALLLPKGHEEHKVPWAVGERNDAV